MTSRPRNPSWNGLTRLVSETNASVLTSLSELRTMADPTQYVLLIMGPGKEFQEEAPEFFEMAEIYLKWKRARQRYEG